MPGKKNVPYIILGFLFIATGLSFLDRQVLSMTIIKIQSELHITDVQYGVVNTSFLIGYALMFTIGGRIMDTIGGRIGMALSVGLWSVACGLHGVLTGFYEFLIFRFFLGAGEGGAFPGAAKIVYEWFDEKRRAMANGIAIGGAAIGAVAAPPIVILVSTHFGWRAAFIIPGIIGVIWVGLWLLIPWKRKYPPTQNVESKSNTADTKISFATILRKKETRVFILIRFLLDPVVYFIMFWAPKYLNEQRGVSFEAIGNLFWIPFLGLGLANIAGGWSSDKLLKNGFSINASRKIVMGISAVVTVSACFTALVSSVEMAIVMMTLFMIAHGFWITNYITAISDIFGTHATATVVGLSGTAGAVSGLLINPLIGWIVQTSSYTPLWIGLGCLYPVAFLIFVLAIPKIKLIQF